MPDLIKEQRSHLEAAIRAAAPEWYKAYELRKQGADGQELAKAFDRKSGEGPSGWASAVDLLLQTSSLKIGDLRRGDRDVQVLSALLLNAEVLDVVLRDYVADTQESAAQAYDTGDYDSPAVQAWKTMRAYQQDEADEDELDIRVEAEVAKSKTYQIYAWTYLGIPPADKNVLVKIGRAGTSVASNAWLRMERVTGRNKTGSPGAPTMLRVWQGEGGTDAAAQSEQAMHQAAAKRVHGGGTEWFWAELDALDRCAKALGLEQHQAVNPA